MEKNRILVVEDEESLLKLESILFTSKGYQVTGVRGGKEALASIAEQAPDIIVLDLMLPDMDGFEVCRHIKENEATRAIPVVMLTAKKSSRDLEHGKQVGANAYITKPFKSIKVLEVIEELLGNQQEKEGR
ncbi:response regulator [Geomonas terrae]|uniref:Response regulator n=1 Tax=Geomonas terrae TaxID=2562681 RepID=A0A4S1CJP3_9BACT|nr:response regulator [Geomonas terrae]TGU73924.1 response regulator [Geomonas terrae]